MHTILFLMGCAGSSHILPGSTDSATEPESETESEIEPAVGPDPFALVVLPDTQYYTESYPEIFYAQTAWIAANLADEGIAFVLHEGDITDNNTDAEWAVAQTAMGALDGLVDYALAVGNHDTGDGGSANVRDTSGFNTAFPIADFQERASFVTSYSSDSLDNAAYTFAAGGLDWLVISLEFGPRDVVLDWANTVAQDHPDGPIIVLSHTHVYSDDSLHGSDASHSWNPHDYGLAVEDGDVNDGTEVWEKFVRRHENIAFTFNGHVLNDGAGRVTGTGDAGNTVHQLLANYQMRDEGGEGWLRLMRFEPGKRRVVIKTYSPWLDSFDETPHHDFTIDDLAAFAALDVEAPSLVSVIATAETSLVVTFDETLSPQTAADPANYQLDGSVAVSATLNDDGKTVVVTVDAMVAGTTHQLAVSGVQDASTNHNEIEPQTASVLYEETTMVADFTDSSLSEWLIIEQGSLGGAADWQVVGGWLGQLSNHYGPDSTAEEGRLGTYAIWSDDTASAWADHTLDVSLWSDDNDGIGLALRYQDEGAHLRFEMDSQRSFQKLFCYVDGNEQLLASTNTGYSQGAVMQLSVEVQGDTAEFFLDGVSVFGEAVDISDAPDAGTIGLFCWGNEGCWFDDVTVIAD